VTASGIVLRTALALDDPQTRFTFSMRVTYGRDAKLAGWMPLVMEERYAQRRDGTEEEVTCTATYSNFRRFETSARIVR